MCKDHRGNLLVIPVGFCDFILSIYAIENANMSKLKSSLFPQTVLRAMAGISGGTRLGETEGAHRTRHPVTLCEELLCIVLCHNSLQDLIADGRQDTLVPVDAQAPEDLGQQVGVRLGKHPQRDVHHLQVCSSRTQMSSGMRHTQSAPHERLQPAQVV